MDDPLAILSRHPYFASLPPNILTAIRDRLIRRHYEKGPLIYSEGEPSQGLYLVESGTVRIFKGSAAVLPTQHELAAQIGTVREVAARGLRYLERLGTIRLEPRRRVTILDRHKLDDLTGNPSAPYAHLGH